MNKLLKGLWDLVVMLILFVVAAICFIVIALTGAWIPALFGAVIWWMIVNRKKQPES